VAISTLRAENPGISDQLLPAFTVVSDGEPVGRVRDGNAVVLFNFRGDRSIELARAFTEADEFKGFDRGTVPNVLFAGMTLYDGDTNLPERRLVEPETVPDTVSEYLARTGVTQWACAETQKYGHVTYFWNGNCSDKFDERTETYLEIPSDQVQFDQRPWMKSAETADAVIKAVQAGSHQFLRANFAGGDMVGHTGAFIPTVIAVEAVDLAIGRIWKEVERAGGCLVVTADHGNAEDMVQRDKQGQPLRGDDGAPRWKTSHSVNPVPFFVADHTGRAIALRQDLPDAGLANVAATVVELLGYEAPTNYEDSLIAPPRPET
jgi:2,3-bisphosphoglycerate-independent phosphoglycerate mutase